MTIDKKWLDEYCKGLRCRITKEQETHILSLFTTEPDEKHTWNEQDICEQIRRILRDTNAIYPANKAVKYE